MEIPVDRGEYHEAPWKILGGGVKLEKKLSVGGLDIFQNHSLNVLLYKV